MSLSQNPVNILLVDDNVSNLTILKEVLDRPEVNIITSNVPGEVVDICLAEDISIALIDVKMPGLSGFELLNQIKQNPLTENVVVILMTGYSMSSEEVFLGLSSGAVDYLFKPLDMHITNAKITSLLTLVNYQREVEKKNKELEFYQKDLFQAVEEAKKGKEIKENFLANMSHEIRTPLNAIVGITNLLKTSELDDQQKEMIRLMDFSSHALLGIVNDVLESFQIDAGKINLDVTAIDVTALFMSVADTMRPLAVEKGLVLHHNIIGKVPAWVKADALRLNQILMNLINNAIKFTVAGQVVVTLKVGEVNDGRTVLEFTVKDSGLGIPENAIKEIFERFEQVQDKSWQKFGGTGLGLSIVKRLAELMGGSIKVNSVLGEGTSFIFTALFEHANDLVTEIEQPLSPTAEELSDLSHVRVLLVEDNVINQFVAIRILQQWNVKVDCALNGLEAFHKVAAQKYDLVLMDTHMPVMNGIESTRKIRTELPEGKNNIPIISFSASVIEHEQKEALDAGVNDFLEKPFHPQILHQKIVSMTKGRATPSAG